MAVQVVRVELLGTSFSVQTDESREYFDTLIAELQRRLEGLRSSTRVGDPLKLAILSNIVLLDELARQRGRASESDEAARLAERLMGRIEAAIGREGGPEPGPGAEVGGRD